MFRKRVTERTMKKILFLVLLKLFQCECGILFPKASEARELLSLDGLWKFALTNQTEFDDTLFVTQNANELDLGLMPVPASYNDISTSANIRDYVGIVLYQRNFFIPKSWSTKNIWLRFGSVCYAARVYINGNLVLAHEIGHLPFVGLIVPSFLNIVGENVITVAVNNILTQTTIPQGELITLVSGRVQQTYTFDFFNYAGIDRSVVLYTTERTYVDDINITTQVDGTVGIVHYDIAIEGNDIFTQKVTILDKEKNVVAKDSGGSINNSLTIADVKLWWPYLMADDPGYQYSLKVDLFDLDENLLDTYEQKFGVRSLAWDNTTFKINGKNIYIRGFGRHEDSDIRGKGFDLPLIIRDHNLIRWVGANCYRTSHYPYAEEIMDLADSLGIMIIDEVPAVNTDRSYSAALMANHKQALTELYRRDKNRPSVVIWSAANEPRTQWPESEDYYRQVIGHIRTLDPTRPITIANTRTYNVDHSGQFLDILSFNKYNAWYISPGNLDTIVPELISEAEGWHKTHNKPVLLTEYGADSLEGLHFLPTFIWSEEFQTDLMSLHFEAFDRLREKGWFIGEMIWNFADFKTAQNVRRVGGNKKGIFTRQRQPKSAAHLIRRRYWALAQLLDNSTQPTDLDNYILGTTTIKDEL